jgi:hypothetical protein
MSDNQRTPQGTARVNSERFDAELAAVWYAANQYYTASFRGAREYIGVVFKDAAGQYGITVRGDGNYFHSKVRIGDVPKKTTPVAVWHTHVNSSAFEDPAAQVIASLISSFDMDWDEFSGDDTALADNTTKALQRSFPIYLVTPTVIRRYRPGSEVKSWPKDPPPAFNRLLKKRAAAHAH